MGKIKNKKGFMMGEAVIAIFIVGTTLITFLSILSSMLKMEFQKRDYIIAANLAQEGIEIVRNIRDNNLKATCGSGSNTRPCNAFEPGMFPANTGPSGSCSTCNGNGIINSKFNREIRILQGPDLENSKTIISRVTWTSTSSSGSESIEISDDLYSWGDNE